MVYRPVRDQLGLARTRACYTGGAPLGAGDVPLLPRYRRQPQADLRRHRGHRAARLPARRRGRSEQRRPAAAGPRHPHRRRRRGTGPHAGRRSRATTSRTTRRAPRLPPTAGCAWATPASSTRAGQLVVIDRARDVGKLLGGEAFAPQFIENKLKFSPFVREAVAFGDERPFVAAMISIDLGTVGNWAERRGLAYTSYMDLTRKPEVIALIGARGGALQRHPAGRAAGAPVPPARQGARRRRRRDDSHPQGPPPLRRREIRRRRRGVLQRRRRASRPRWRSPTRTAARRCVSNVTAIQDVRRTNPRARRPRPQSHGLRFRPAAGHQRRARSA